MTTAEATKTHESKKDIDRAEMEALAERIRGSVEFVLEEAAVKPTAPVYADNAASYGTSIEEIGRVEHYNTHFAAATTKVIGEVGQQAIADNPEVNRVTGKIPLFGKNEFNVSVDRSGTVRNPKTGEVTEVHGVVRTEWVQTAGANRGLMSEVRASLRETGEASLNKGK